MGVRRNDMSGRAAYGPWLPLVVIVLAQLSLAVDISALPVSLGPISQDLDAPATAAATALLIYSLFVPAFVMLGAKIGKLVGERRVLQVSVVAPGAGDGPDGDQHDAWTMNTAQAMAGLAAAAGVPTFVVLIAANYHGRRHGERMSPTGPSTGSARDRLIRYVSSRPYVTSGDDARAGRDVELREHGVREQRRAWPARPVRDRVRRVRDRRVVGPPSPLTG